MPDAPGDARREHEPCRGADADDPALPARRLSAVHGARGFAEHRAVEAARRVVARQSAVYPTEAAAVVAKQIVQIAVGIVVHVANLARIRASA